MPAGKNEIALLINDSVIDVSFAAITNAWQWE